MEFQIRKAGMDDAKIIAEYNKAMALETESKILDGNVLLSGVQSLMRNPEYGFYIVAEHEDKIVGCCMVTTEWSDWRNGLFWWIQSVFVHPDFRRNGVYKNIYNFVKDLSKINSNVCGYRLYVEKENTKAQLTYKNLGMEETDYKLFEEMK